MMQLTAAIRGAGVSLAAAVLVTVLATSGAVGGVRPVARTAPGASDAHRYRIIGRLRLGLFSITRDGVGGARTHPRDLPRRGCSLAAVIGCCRIGAGTRQECS